MVEHCQTQCKQTGGAIFCDGQFLNADNVNSCAEELSAKIKINVDIKASVTVAAQKTKAAVTSAGQKAGSVNVCTVANVGAGSAGGAFGALSSLAALALWQTRRRRDHR
jgi:MYXO-CTERM domain-containing protein